MDGWKGRLDVGVRREVGLARAGVWRGVFLRVRMPGGCAVNFVFSLLVLSFFRTSLAVNPLLSLPAAMATGYGTYPPHPLVQSHPPLSWRHAKTPLCYSYARVQATAGVI